MENVIAVGVQLPGQDTRAIHASLEELERLVETAGGRVVERRLQKRERRDPALYIGKGKAAEIRAAARALEVRTIVFDEELKPSQQRNLEEIFEAKVVDRTRLILDIFAQRARSREGILQVELAQLHYRLPRLTGYGTMLDSQTGGIGTRGPGERKLEVDRRKIRDRMAHLKIQIEKISGERALQRSVRRSIPVPQISLVGYTNTGKSTLLNALLRHTSGASRTAGREVYADDKLFATLDPTTRRIHLPSGRTVLATDTVGFIRKLPTELVAAFRATLEETASADLLVHVIDASDPNWRAQEKTVVDVLKDLAMDQLPRLAAYNKIDCLLPSQRHPFQSRDGALISAQTGEHLGEFLEAVEQHLARQWIEKEVFIPFQEGRRLSLVHEYLEILSQKSTPQGIRLRLRGYPATFAQIFHDAC
jgi:GTP-binding protein HflX